MKVPLDFSKVLRKSVSSSGKTQVLGEKEK